MPCPGLSAECRGSGGCCAAQLMRKKAQGKGRGRGGAPVTKLEPVASFFTFFSPPKVLCPGGPRWLPAGWWAAHAAGVLMDGSHPRAFGGGRRCLMHACGRGLHGWDG